MSRISRFVKDIRRLDKSAFSLTRGFRAAAFVIAPIIVDFAIVHQPLVEQFIARCANSQDPQKLLDVLEKIWNIGLQVPLVELEEYIKQIQAEKETLLHEIDETRAIIDSVNVDRQTIEEYKELKSEMDKYHLEDPKKILNVLPALKKYKYEDKRHMIKDLMLRL